MSHISANLIIIFIKMNDNDNDIVGLTNVWFILKNDYPYIKELSEYKNNGTLALLKSQSAIAFYNGKLGLNVKSKIKSWGDFVEFSRNYTERFIREGLEKYQNEERYLPNQKQKYKVLDMEFLGPIINFISEGINNSFLKKFPEWPTNKTQEDILEVSMKGQFESNCLKLFWLCRGNIYVKKTRYDPPRDGYPYKAKYFGKPELQISYFDLDKIRLCNEIAKQNKEKIKNIIDTLDKKFIEQGVKNLLTNFDI